MKNNALKFRRLETNNVELLVNPHRIRVIYFGFTNTKMHRKGPTTLCYGDIGQTFFLNLVITFNEDDLVRTPVNLSLHASSKFELQRKKIIAQGSLLFENALTEVKDQRTESVPMTKHSNFYLNFFPSFLMVIIIFQKISNDE